MLSPALPKLPDPYVNQYYRCLRLISCERIMGQVLVRAFSFLGLGGGFLMISPKLRMELTQGVESLTRTMELYSPYSYIGGVALVLLMLAISLYRGAQPR